MKHLGDQALPCAGANAPICDAVFVPDLEPLDTVSKRLVVQLLIGGDVVELETEHFECAPYVRACDCSVADLENVVIVIRVAEVLLITRYERVCHFGPSSLTG
jgi:hypothetical protein